jgi:hypothetical protein
LVYLKNLLLEIVVICSAARVLGWGFEKLHQPRVVGEILAGILLGPSLLGWLAHSRIHIAVSVGRTGTTVFSQSDRPRPVHVPGGRGAGLAGVPEIGPHCRNHQQHQCVGAPGGVLDVGAENERQFLEMANASNSDTVVQRVAH